LLLKTTLCYSVDVVDDHYKNTRCWGGQLYKWRSLLDSASQVYFIIEAMVNILGELRRRNFSLLKGINIVASDARYSINIQLCSRYSRFQAEIMCFILLKITGNVPAQYSERDLW
jgi:hypothetical protein